MNKFYTRLICLILLVLVISGSVIYFTVDINTLTNLTVFKPWSVALAIVFVGIGLVLDGTRLMHLVKISNEHITLMQAVQVVFGNYFLALLGPGATGGAVAQLMFLRRAGVPTGKATVLVLVRTCCWRQCSAPSLCWPPIRYCVRWSIASIVSPSTPWQLK